MLSIYQLCMSLLWKRALGLDSDVHTLCASHSQKKKRTGIFLLIYHIIAYPPYLLHSVLAHHNTNTDDKELWKKHTGSTYVRIFFTLHSPPTVTKRKAFYPSTTSIPSKITTVLFSVSSTTFYIDVHICSCCSGEDNELRKTNARLWWFVHTPHLPLLR